MRGEKKWNEYVPGPGTRFWKDQVTSGPKAVYVCRACFKIKVSIMVCAVGTFLLFNRFLFQNLRSGPKGSRAFPETGPWSVILRGLSNDDDDGKENGKQPIGLDWQNNHFASASRFFVHFNFTFCRGREHKTTTCFFFFWTLLQLFRIQLQKKKIANIWRIEWVGISAIKFEVARIHILTYFFLAVAVVVALAPYFTHRLGLFGVGKHTKRFKSLVSFLVRESPPPSSAPPTNPITN